MDDSQGDQLDEFSDCLRRVRDGSGEAVAELFDRYFSRSVRLARSRLSEGEGRLIDEEAAVMSALDSLIVRMRGGAYEDINDHLQLWRLLARIVDRKIIKYRRHMYGPTRSPQHRIMPVEQPGDSSSAFEYVPVAASSPSPISGLIADETLQLLLERLDDQGARSVLLLRLEGFSDIEIANSLRHSRRWVYRRGLAIKRIANTLLRDDG